MSKVSNSERKLLWGYGTAVLSVSVALLIAHWPVLASGVCSGIAVPVCGDAQCVVRWVGPGLVATLLSAVAFYYSFLPPYIHWFSSPVR